jgi:hypothetical protein
VKHFLLFLLLIFFNVGCSMNQSDYASVEVRKLIDTYCNQLKKEGILNTLYGLDWAGPDKVYDGKVHKVVLGYCIDKNLKYEEARKLFYRVVNGLLQELNTKEDLRECFYHYPVTYEDLHFSLSFDYTDKGHLKKDDVYRIAIFQNEIFYYIVTVDGATVELVPDKEIYPGFGTLTPTGQDTMRVIRRKLPETDEH